MSDQLDIEAQQAYEEYARAEAAAGCDMDDPRAQRIWKAAWLAARATAPVSFKAESPPQPDPFAETQKFGMAKLEIGHPSIYPGEFIRLSDARQALKADRIRHGLHVVKIHKFGKRNSPRHEYEMSDGSVVVMHEKEALLSVAGHQQTLSAKDATITDLRAAIGRLLEETELSKIAKMIVKKYADQADDFVTSIGAWLPDTVIPGNTEFVSYLAIPMSDWRRYATFNALAAQPGAAASDEATQHAATQ